MTGRFRRLRTRVPVSLLMVAFGCVLLVVLLADRLGQDEPRTARGSTGTADVSVAAGRDPRGTSFVEPSATRGSIGLFVNAKSSFDSYTRDPSPSRRQWMREHYAAMLVYSPYFDERLEWFDRAFVYRDLYAIYVDPDRDHRSTEHPEWVLRDASGDPVYIPWGCTAPGGCPQYAADIGNPAFRTDFLEALSGLVATGYSGLALDDVNMDWRFGDQQGGATTPIDPRSGAPLRLDEWRRYTAEFVEEIREAFPHLHILHNAIWYADSPAFDDPFVTRQIRAADYIMLERGANDDGLVAGESTFGFRSWLRYIDRVHQLGTSIILLDETATTSREQRFNLAAGLLVNAGRDLVGTEQISAISPEGYFEEFDVDLGDAISPRYEWQGVFRRDFTRGTVVLNEREAATAVVRLDRELVDLEGRPVTTLRLRPAEAMILSTPD